MKSAEERNGKPPAEDRHRSGTSVTESELCRIREAMNAQKRKTHINPFTDTVIGEPEVASTAATCSPRRLEDRG